mgnify:CR=1 FL=1
MARERQYRVHLTEKERKIVKHFRKKSSCDTQRKRYDVILNSDEGKYGCDSTYEVIAARTGVCVTTVINVLRIFCREGLEKAVALDRNPRSDVANLKATGDVEAKIIAKACSRPPDGRVRWTIRMLADESMVILETSLSRATIGRVLQRNALHPHINEYWCIPPEEDAEFAAAMEDVLNVYAQPYNPKQPLWCMDEKPYQLLGEARTPIPMKPGKNKKIDSEYTRPGTASIACFIQPHTGRIIHDVRPTRTSVDWAEWIKYIVDEVEPGAEKIILVMDNLNIHAKSSLYKAFSPAEAWRIASKLDIHFTPKHGSWLDIAEIGIHIMSTECLDRRISTYESLKSELKAWNDDYNLNPAPIHWQFTLDDARTKLRRLYPNVEDYRKQRDERQQAKQFKVSSAKKGVADY